jgi:hypothetical protein
MCDVSDITVPEMPSVKVGLSALPGRGWGFGAFLDFFLQYLHSFSCLGVAGKML